MLASRLTPAGGLLIRGLATLGLLTAAAPAQILIKPAQQLVYQTEGPQANSFYADPVQGVGDINRDGYPDYMVGDPHTAVHLHSGKTGALLYTMTKAVSGFSQNGRISGTGDVNKDGFLDIIVGATGSNTIYVLSGAYMFKQIGKETLYTINAGSNPGYARDVNKDGYDDILVGDWSAQKVSVFSGKDGKLLYSRTGTGRYGSSVDGMGDVNKDGYPDIAVGAYQYNGKGRVEIVSGQFMIKKTGKEVLYTFDGENAGDNLTSLFQNGIEGGVDINKDSWPDLVVGADGFDGKAGSNSGKVYVISGRYIHIGGKPELLYSFEGDTAGGRLGVDTNIAEDVNRDGFPDIIGGAPYVNGSAGRATVWSGLNGKKLFHIDGEASGHYLGWRVDGVGDVNKDGYGEVVVGAWGWNGSFGRAYVVSGKKLSLVADEHMHTLTGTANNKQSFMLDAGTGNANKNYLLATSFDRGPIQVGGLTIPLKADLWFNITLPMILSKNAFFPGWLGQLDNKGTGSASWTLPRVQSKTLIGTTLWQAYIVFDNNGWYMASNAVPMTLIQ